MFFSIIEIATVTFFSNIRENCWKIGGGQKLRLTHAFHSQKNKILARKIFFGAFFYSLNEEQKQKRRANK